MKSNYYFIFLVMLLLGCIKEKSTISNTNFINTTNHFITVNAFQNGNIDSKNSFSLAPYETKNIFHFNNRGIGEGMTFGGINHPKDSFLVIFDTQHTMVHYKPTLIGNSIKRYLYSSKRNIYNDSSYVSNLIKDSKYRREWDFKYTFVEQDYLDAR